MRPGFPSDDLPSRIVGDPVEPAYSFYGDSALCIAFAQSNDLWRSDLRPTVLLASQSLLGMGVLPVPLTSGLTALRDHIVHVLLMRTSEEMAWPSAGRVIATMQGIFTRWEWAVHKLVDHAIDSPWFPINADLSVAVGIAIPLPRPAPFRDLHASKQANNQGRPFMEWIAVPLKAFVVSSAIASCDGFLRAIRYRAFHGQSISADEWMRRSGVQPFPGFE